MRKSPDGEIDGGIAITIFIPATFKQTMDEGGLHGDCLSGCFGGCGTSGEEKTTVTVQDGATALCLIEEKQWRAESIEKRVVCSE